MGAALLRIAQSMVVGVHMSIAEMRSHRLRSALSMVGVMLGVAALVAMLTLVGGIQVFLNEKMAKWTGSIWVWTKWDPPDEEKISWSRSPGLKFSDGQWLEEESADVDRMYGSIRREGEAIIAGKALGHTHPYGVDLPTFGEDTAEVELSGGRWLSEEDFGEGKRVCMVSWDLEERLLRASGRSGAKIDSLIGKQAVFANLRLEIVGTFRPKDPEFRPRQLRQTIVMPLRTMRKYVTGYDPNPGSIRLQMVDPSEMETRSERVARMLTSRHRGVEDFEYRGPDHARDMTRMLENVSLLMSIISVISLLVGGMSIMNVMLSSISERIHEIGVRKALGAKTLQIFVQFITETTTLSFTGGLVGMALGTAPLFFKEAVRKSTEGAITPTVLPLHALFVFVVIAAVGIAFGLYPAMKASRMDPVEALRYE